MPRSGRSESPPTCTPVGLAAGLYILATAKHYIGDGGTFNGVDRGDNRASEEELLKIHAQGYIAAIQAGAQTVMVSYNSWQGIKIHGHRYLITDVLKNDLGFDGLVVSDWDGIDEVQACAKDKCPVAVNAGIDLFMVPTDWKAFLENTVSQVKAGGTVTLSVDGQYKTKPDVAIVVFGENPYSEWHGDIRSLDYSEAKRAEAIEAANPSPQPAPQVAAASLGKEAIGAKVPSAAEPDLALLRPGRAPASKRA